MKLTLIENDNGIDISESVRPLVDRANKVIAQALRTKRNALILSNGKLKAIGIAGSIRLTKDIELEIVPKMLTVQDAHNWKESLFLLAALSKYGNIITSEHIHSNTDYKDSLYDIAGRVLAREYFLHRRKPIRQYRREEFFDFAIDGEVRFDLLFEKNPDGIPQMRVSFDKINPFNTTIQSAMRIVLPYVKDISIREQLNRAIQELGRQSYFARGHYKVPSRNKEWAVVYNLAQDIVIGMGSSLENGEILSPSFIVDTWRIWEWLITIAFRVGLGNMLQVVPQATIPWGQMKSARKKIGINVFPDVAIYTFTDMSTPVFLVDAKYKTLTGASGIDREDLYEAFAFCHASGAKKLFLVYPKISAGNAEPGSISSVADFEIDDITISAIQVAFGLVTKQGDITKFCRKLSDEIMKSMT